MTVYALIAASATAVAPALGAHGSRAAAATYLVALTGTQQTVAVRSGTVRDDSGCSYAVDHVDRQLLAFSARRKARLDLRPGGKLPQIGLAARVVARGSRHRQSALTGGDADVCGPANPPQTYRC